MYRFVSLHKQNLNGTNDLPLELIAAVCICELEYLLFALLEPPVIE